MDTIYEKMKKTLESNPTGRERRNKWRLIAWMMWKKHELDNNPINSTILESLIFDASSYDRAWRQVLEKNENLRGTDYANKKILEEEKILELGYQPGIGKEAKKIGEISKPYDDK